LATVPTVTDGSSIIVMVSSSQELLIFEKCATQSYLTETQMKWNDEHEGRIQTKLEREDKRD
jgi:hypothetical protein